MSNNKQETAVEWFHQKTWALKIQLEKGEISIGEYANTYATLYEQAKEMEKEQTKNRAVESYYSYTQYLEQLPKIGGATVEMDFERYYNETYGGEEQ
jgi:hypothetical protein